MFSSVKWVGNVRTLIKRQTALGGSLPATGGALPHRSIIRDSAEGAGHDADTNGSHRGRLRRVAPAFGTRVAGEQIG